MANSQKAISSWIRQIRFRAKKHNLYSDLSIKDVQEVFEYYQKNCILCEKTYASLDMAFPLKNGGPSVQANVILLCEYCKAIKKNDDLLALERAGKISESQLLDALKKCFNLKHGDVLNNHVKALSGHIDTK